MEKILQEINIETQSKHFKVTLSREGENFGQQVEDRITKLFWVKDGYTVPDQALTDALQYILGIIKPASESLISFDNICNAEIIDVDEQRKILGAANVDVEIFVNGKPAP